MVAVQAMVVDPSRTSSVAGTGAFPVPGRAYARGWVARRVSYDPPIGSAASDDHGTVPGRFAVDCHPTFTMVVTARSAAGPVAAVLRSALHSGHDGLHVEFADDAGREFVVFRPHGDRHRLIDLETAATLPMPMLGEYGVVGAPADPVVRAARVEVIAWLAAADQTELWKAASMMQRVRDAIYGSVEHDTPTSLSHELDVDHRRGARRFRLLSRDRPETAHRSIADQLTDAAAATWGTVAGDVRFDDALAMRPAIEACARIGSRLRALSAVSCTPAAATEVSYRDLAEALIDVVLVDPAVRTPHVVELPGEALVPEVWSLVLDHLVAAADERQVIVVTADRNTADWGRLEAHARRAAVVEIG